MSILLIFTTINGGLIIQNFTNGALGMTLKDNALASFANTDPYASNLPQLAVAA